MFVSLRQSRQGCRPTISGNKTHYPALNVVYNFTPRGSRFQPYVTVGGGFAQLTPTSKAEAYARFPSVDAVFQSARLNDNLEAALNCGGGVKFHLSEHLGLRFDVRGFFSHNPTFDLSSYHTSGIYIPVKNAMDGVQATLGLVVYVKQPYKVPVPPPPLHEHRSARARSPEPAPLFVKVKSSPFTPLQVTRMGTLWFTPGN